MHGALPGNRPSTTLPHVLGLADGALASCRCFARHAQMSERPNHEAIERLQEWAHNELERDDERAAIQMVEQEQQANTARPFDFQRIADAAIEIRAAVVQGLGFDAGAVVALVGVPNGGKTALAISLALAVTTGITRWMNLKTATGPALYLAPEAPASVRMRARAALLRMGSPAPSAALYVSDGVPLLGDERDFVSAASRVMATVDAVKLLEQRPVLIVFIDTLASCLGDGDENGPGMLRLVSMAKLIAQQTGACVVLIHHPSKGDGASLRGHGSLAAACDSIVRIETDDLTGIRTAVLVKARDHATGLQIRFELEPVTLPERDSFGDQLTTVVVKPSDRAAPRPRPSGQRQQQLLGELERRHRVGERQWDEATVRQAARDLGMSRSSAPDAMRGLIKAGYLTGSVAAYYLRHPPEEAP
jgi:hypothetical protein